MLIYLQDKGSTSVDSDVILSKHKHQASQTELQDLN